MIIVFKKGTEKENIANVQKKLESYGFKVHLSEGVETTIMGAIGDESTLRDKPLSSFPGVEKVVPIVKPYKLVSKDFRKEDTVIDVKGIKLGGGNVVVMAGPCSVEGRDMLFEIAGRASKAGAKILRGGAFKPRTSPYAFQGLGEEGLKYLREAADAHGMLVITELMDPRDIDLICKYTDIIQIGARNMQNFRLLRDLGELRKPVMLKRGLCATMKELLMAAEYVAAGGNNEIILCERGIRTFETETRNTLDLSAIPVLKSLTHLPVVADPSHGTGRRDCILPMSQAAVAAGADGIIVEVHNCPEEAMSDGDQSILPDDFDILMKRIDIIAQTIGKTLNK
ncbi:phospho-2-dehydro-3-deoxyheptonate aldolase [Denitrovibrio acetiphilus DSM 12809]|uniref:Phospho-2-dehydro-3-deoxyheptonate aldolase n=1 Tax=Denitrovibrio acetiphilus (strain DSM 12809 / NBRC 114555 / N2460) TaxID=522772 RepID=D4H702_DENA2|nr:3-deoxy-7-phosphoheptulonate synthase [Denitrovibrio acetiphilus]ADD69706.1 phospho-2-dehydro-3-deoxyheptonate aldolase [Denitrovibrio acetiphilus DSM 12809]